MDTPPNPTRILLFGRNGQLGAELSLLLPPLGELRAVGREDANLEDLSQLRHAIRQFSPDVIINAAAYTAVDAAEEHESLARLVNAQAPAVMAEEAAGIGARMIHYSTDYVFDGTKGSPYSEGDQTGPLNVYGRTKLEGERAIQNAGCAHLIFRTSWLYAAQGTNFYRTILRLAKERPRLRIVNDQFGVPTSALSVAQASVAVLREWMDLANGMQNSGIYHMVGSGQTSWMGFAREILELAGMPSVEIEGVSTEEYGARAKRPRNSVLSATKLEERFRIKLPAWEQQLADVITHSQSLVGQNQHGRSTG